LSFLLYFSTTSTHAPRDEARSWNSNPLATPNGYLPAPLNVLPARSTIPTRLTDAVGALLTKLEDEGLDEDTMVFFFKDHGTEDGKASTDELRPGTTLEVY
jgi:hypothetical protein